MIKIITPIMVNTLANFGMLRNVHCKIRQNVSQVLFKTLFKRALNYLQNKAIKRPNPLSDAQ